MSSATVHPGASSSPHQLVDFLKKEKKRISKLQIAVEVCFKPGTHRGDLSELSALDVHVESLIKLEIPGSKINGAVS